jgi:hypothetical protein
VASSSGTTPTYYLRFLDIGCYTNAVVKLGAGTAGWVENHPAEAAGIALGAASLATGVGEVLGVSIAIGELTIGPPALGVASLTTGSIGFGLDLKECVRGDVAACVGAGLIVPGELSGVADLLPRGLISEQAKTFGDWFSLGSGAVASGFDFARVICQP